VFISDFAFILFSFLRIAPFTGMTENPSTVSHPRLAGEGKAFRQTGKNQWKTMDSGEYFDRLR